MADSTVSSVNSLTGLPNISINATGMAKVFKDTISYVLAYEEQPLLRLQKDRDALNLRKQAYADIQTKLSALQTATQALMSGGFSQLEFGRSVTVTPGTVNTTVATAAAANSAVVGTYNLSVSQLALSYVHISATQTSSTDALNRSGTFIVGGNGTATTSEVSDTGSVLNAPSISSVAGGVTELGEDTYTIETRNFNGTMQFRIRDQDGNAVSVADKNATDNTLTSDWQTLTAGAFDTKRGLTINFSGITGASATIEYKPAGTTINVNTGDSLVSIAEKINSSGQGEGRKIAATVISNQLVFTGPTGVNNQITFTDNVGLGFTQQQAGRNAMFSVNNIVLSRQSNTVLTDVIQGVTLNLASDSEGRNAAIDIKENAAGARSTIDSYIEAFNSVVDFIDTKSALTKNDDGLTYTRGALSNDTVFEEMRSKLFDLTMGQYVNSGSYSLLSEVGLELGDDLKLKVADSDKLDNALNTKFSDVKSLMNAAMSGVNTTLNNFTGTSGYIQSSTDVLTSEFLDLSDSIQTFQLRMIERKSNLETQYADMQSQLLMMQYTFQAWQGIYGNTQSMLG